MQARALAHERGGAPLSALHARVPGCPRTLAIAARSAIVCFGLNFMPSSTSCMSSRPWRTSLRKTWPRSLVSWCPGTRLVPPTSRLLFWWLGGNGGEGGGKGGARARARHSSAGLPPNARGRRRACCACAGPGALRGGARARACGAPSLPYTSPPANPPPLQSSRTRAPRARTRMRSPPPARGGAQPHARVPRFGHWERDLHDRAIRWER